MNKKVFVRFSIVYILLYIISIDSIINIGILCFSIFTVILFVLMFSIYSILHNMSEKDICDTFWYKGGLTE